MTTELSEKPKILIICNYYLPGYKGGGSLRTIVNMVERLDDRFDFWIITRDHDGDDVQFEGVKINEWNTLTNAQVLYLSKDKINISKLRELISEVKPNSIYLNSIFAAFSVYTLLLRKLYLIPKINIIIAPEGELAESALKIKANKKKAFLKSAKLLGLHKNIIWKTTAPAEQKEAEDIKGNGGQIFIAPNLTARTFLSNYRQELKPLKTAGAAKMIFLSRFVPIKNFNWLMQFLPQAVGNLTIDIYGNLEDAEYWSETQQLIKEMPENISINYCGSVTHDLVVETIFKYHFFILPTLGENFGHVFIEALAAGCPLLISNRTPWKNLEEKNIGWDVMLEKTQVWLDKVNLCISLDGEAYSEMSGCAREFAVKWLNASETELATLAVLQASL